MWTYIFTWNMDDKHKDPTCSVELTYTIQLPEYIHVTATENDMLMLKLPRYDLDVGTIMHYASADSVVVDVFNKVVEIEASDLAADGDWDKGTTLEQAIAYMRHIGWQWDGSRMDHSIKIDK